MNRFFFSNNDLLLSLLLPGMFLSSLIESRQNDVIIKEMDYHVLKSLVEFCYASRIKIDSTNVLELLSAANMLQFDDIKQCCSEFLGNRLDATNCLTIANFADLHTCHSLKESAIEFSKSCLLYTSPSPRDLSTSRMPSSA